MRYGGSQRTVWPGESVSFVLPQWNEVYGIQDSDNEMRHNKDCRKHAGQKQHGQVTAIVLVSEKPNSRLFTRVLPKVTAQSRIMPVFPVKIQ